MVEERREAVFGWLLLYVALAAAAFWTIAHISALERRAAAVEAALSEVERTVGVRRQPELRPEPRR